MTWLDVFSHLVAASAGAGLTVLVLARLQHTRDDRLARRPACDCWRCGIEQ